MQDAACVCLRMAVFVLFLLPCNHIHNTCIIYTCMAYAMYPCTSCVHACTQTFCAASSVCFLTRSSSSINLQAVALIPSPMPLVPSCGQVSSLAIRRARRASSYSCLHLSALCLSNSLCLALCNAKTHGREESVLKNACDVSIT